MDAEKVIKLIDAGFTTDEIRKMLATSPAAISTAEAPEPSPAPEAAPAEEPKEAPAERSAEEIINEKMNEAFKPFADLYTKMSKLAGMPSMEDVAPKSIDDVISNFFKEA